MLSLVSKRERQGRFLALPYAFVDKIIDTNG
jgi:hypothetical protein